MKKNKIISLCQIGKECPKCKEITWAEEIKDCGGTCYPCSIKK